MGTGLSGTIGAGIEGIFAVNHPYDPALGCQYCQTMDLGFALIGLTIASEVLGFVIGSGSAPIMTLRRKSRQQLRL